MQGNLSSFSSLILQGNDTKTFFTIHHQAADQSGGFTQEWSNSSDQRVARRQIEVQANITGNPNRPEYRTVTADRDPRATGDSQQVPLYEQAEERTFTIL